MKILILVLILIYVCGQLLGGVVHTDEDKFPYDDFRHM